MSEESCNDICRLRIEFENNEIDWEHPLDLVGRTIKAIYVNDERIRECYACSKLAELRAENNALRGKVDELAANDGNVLQPVTHAPERVTNQGEMLHDSREKLEADVNEFVINTLERGLLTYGAIIKLLDRQAAITEREFIEAECMKCAKADKERESDHSEALAERDGVIAVLKAENAELQSRHCEWSDPDSLGDGCMLRKDKRVDELTAERDEWREAAGNAHEMWEQADNERIKLAEQLEASRRALEILTLDKAKLQTKIDKLEGGGDD